MKKQITKPDCAKKTTKIFSVSQRHFSQRCHQQSDLGGLGKTGLKTASWAVLYIAGFSAGVNQNISMIFFGFLLLSPL